MAAHVPFLLSADGGAVDLHLVRSNPVARTEGPAMLAVLGPDGYVSPDWYGIDDEVPTWNYVAVHLRGRFELRPQDELPDLLDRLSAAFEARLVPKKPWTMAKMPIDLADRLMRMIVPARLNVESVESTYKLGQNKPDAARHAAAAAMTDGIGQGLADIAALMREA